jgi:hypothetical protein
VGYSGQGIPEGEGKGKGKGYKFVNEKPC